ncbi:hypothetical protein [Ureibacillus sp. GCM10028918]|uniref:hypothetical protein n=1 Tax=Ureibacillus sp. GCM10028918 TaxID=3273429 RepID=UPI003620408A
MMESLFSSFFGVMVIIFAYMLLVKIISKVYHWIRWQRMNPTERKYEKIRQQRRRNYNASSKKSYDASPPGGD